MSHFRTYQIIDRQSGSPQGAPFSFDNVSAPRFFTDYDKLEVGEACPALRVNGHGGTWDTEQTTPLLLKRIT